MKIYVNQKIAGQEQTWSAKNGATRRSLVLVNKTGQEGKEFQGKLGFLDKGNHSFIFINPAAMADDDKIVGIFLNSSYAYKVIPEHSPQDAVIFENYSSGGYGNSCSQFGIYRVGTTLAEFSYKNRRGETYWRLTADGWEEMGRDVCLDEREVTEVS